MFNELHHTKIHFFSYFLQQEWEQKLNIQYPLTYLVDSNNFSVGGVDAWENYHNKVINNNLQDQMDRIIDRNNIESIRKTMQMHEDIFKNQVKELHRVYNVQKMLMDEHKNQNKLWTPMNGTIGINHSYFIQQKPTQISFSHVQILKEELQIKERSGSIKKLKNDFDIEKHEESGCDEEVEVDLTLCIGINQTKKKKNSSYNLLPNLVQNNGIKSKESNSYVSFESDRVGDCSEYPTTPMGSSSVTFNQDQKGPHWLSQGLKLK